jgi:hypothetical protein
MTTSTRAPASARRRSGFTLIELIIATTRSSLVLVGVMSTFLFLARASVAAANYSDMEVETRAAIEIFARDVRMASNVTWNSDDSVTLAVDTATGRTNVTYAYNANAVSGRPARSFTRTIGANTEVLVTGIRVFEYTAYKINTEAISLASINTATNQMTKQIQISMEIERRRPTVALTTDKVISARFVLRNKAVTV